MVAVSGPCAIQVVTSWGQQLQHRPMSQGDCLPSLREGRQSGLFSALEGVGLLASDGRKKKLNLQDSGFVIFGWLMPRFMLLSVNLRPASHKLPSLGFTD